MAKAVYSPMKPHKAASKGVRSPEGRMTAIYQVDANSPTFGAKQGRTHQV
jgi:hypothetical protein